MFTAIRLTQFFIQCWCSADWLVQAFHSFFHGDVEIFRVPLSDCVDIKTVHPRLKNPQFINSTCFDLITVSSLAVYSQTRTVDCGC